MHTNGPKFLVYRTQCDTLMRARIMAKHADGSFTVQPYFYQRDGKDEPDGLFQGGHLVSVPKEFVIEHPALPARDADLREAAAGDKCSACGRDSFECSTEPCEAVIADREDEAPSKDDHLIIEEARTLYCADSAGNIEIDEDTKLSRSDTGTWVQAWVFVPNS